MQSNDLQFLFSYSLHVSQIFKTPKVSKPKVPPKVLEYTQINEQVYIWIHWKFIVYKS